MRRNHSRLRAGTVLIALFGLTLSGVASAATSKVISESSKGKVVSVKIGSTFSVVLNSTYWQYAPLAVTKAIVAQADPVTAAIFPGPTAPAGCTHPGTGCGTVTWKFKAEAIGSAIISASRTTCGEAMRCVGTQGAYAVTVKVTR